MTAVATRIRGRRHAAIGARWIWLCGAVLLGLQMIATLTGLLVGLSPITDPLPLVTGWIVLIVANAGVVAVTIVLGEHLPDWLFWLWSGALLIALALDLVANRRAPDPAALMTVGNSAALSLLLAVVTRPALEVIGAAVALTGAAGLFWVLTPAYTESYSAETVFALGRMLLPVTVAALVYEAFRRMVRRETEEVLSHAAVAAPRLTVGIEASEQLARLDLAAESLLAAVADGRMRLPLTAEVAKRAGGLASDLRLHLLASRSTTWLALAIEESTLLRHDVRIEDDGAAAGLLGTRQRAALLSALWLLHDDRVRAGRPAQAPIRLTFGMPASAFESEAFAAVSIRIDVPGSTRTRIQPGVWQHLAQVGRYRERLDGSGMRIDIHCLVPPTRGTSRDRTE